MLQLLYGAAGTGKSRAILERIQNAPENNGRKIMLIVPEQFSFESERKLLSLLGGRGFACVEVYSFTRLCHHMFELYGGNAKPYADETAKLLFMELALHEVADTLEHYKRVSGSRQFLASALRTVEELKVNGVSPKQYEEAVLQLEQGVQRQKLQEISDIYAVYQGILERSNADILDDFSKALKLAEQNHFFDGYDVYLDEFKGFTKPEFDLIEQMLIQAASCTVALCMDVLGQDEPLFTSVRTTADRLRHLAVKHRVTVKRSELLTENHRFLNETLSELECSLFRRRPERAEHPAKGLQIFLADNEYEEVNFALSGILELVREKGLRFRDIVVMTRDLETYQSILEPAFEKYGIPYFIDSRFGIENFPPIRFALALLETAASRFQTDSVLTLLKCGMLPFTLEEISELENYVYLWDIDGARWKADFTANPEGFKGELAGDQQQKLDRLNAVRAFLMKPLADFAERARRAPVHTICRAFYRLLEKLEVPRTLQQQAAELERHGAHSEAADLLRVWEILMGILDTLHTAAGELMVNLTRFSELFALAVQKGELADRPQTLDCVLVGSPERMRTDSPDALFLLGVNDGVFPYIPNDGTLLKDEERTVLHELGLDLEGDTRKKLLEERFVAYKALTVPRRFLTLTARRADIAGEVKQPSELIGQLTTLFGEQVILNGTDLPPLYFCTNEETAFSQLALNYSQRTDYAKTLYACFSADPRYAGRLQRLEKALLPRAFQLADNRMARRLFGERAYLSPSRVESYYRCPFSYFCRYGLKALPRVKAELNPAERGMAVHDLLYRFVSEYGERMFELNHEEIAAIVSRFLDDYIVSVMGGAEDKPKRFLAAYYRLRSTMCNLLERLIAEFRQSRFRPSDFELEIGSSEDVEPIRLQTADGGEIQVSGTIDRVDVCEIDGQKYVRVVDYKSGFKKFKLSDVYYGLNLQMILYLFAIWKNGKERYADVLPAGVLYMPAGEAAPALGRAATETDTKEHLLAQYRMNGFVLEDPEVVQAMEPDVKGVFIPVGQNKDGSFSKRSSLLRLEELGKLERYVERLVIHMAEELAGGSIEARPTFSGGSRPPCEYCDYATVCGNKERASAFQPVDDFNKEQFFERIGGNADDGTQLDG